MCAALAGVLEAASGRIPRPWAAAGLRRPCNRRLAGTLESVYRAKPDTAKPQTLVRGQTVAVGASVGRAIVVGVDVAASEAVTPLMGARVGKSAGLLGSGQVAGV